jgi:hypothetical protein
LQEHLSKEEEESNHRVRVNALAKEYGSVDVLLRCSLNRDGEATMILLNFIADALLLDRELPKPPKRYTAAILRAAAMKCEESGGSRRSPWHRNIGVIGALEILEKAGIPPTKNAGSEVRCGCDVVADILGKAGHNISGRGVADVWDTYRDILSPLIPELSRSNTA